MSPIPRKIRVLIVDDSVTIRRLLTESLASDPDFEVAGTAANGKIAIAKIGQTPPDIVTLDVEMPEMDGLATLVEIRKSHPKLPVVMFSSLTERAAATTLEALARGATDYFAKPSGSAGLTGSMKAVREGLLPRLKSLVFPGKGAAAHKPPPQLTTARIRVDMLAIGASTGGPNAVADMLARLPKLPIPAVITQHMPVLFTRMFAERLAASTPHRVREARHGDALEPGLMLIAPGDYHMTLYRDGAITRVKLDQGPPENSCRPAVDPMFRSVAELYGAHTLAVVLTGMGQDGLRGCEQVRTVGGQILAQDEASSVVWGMPGFVVRANLADAVGPPETLAMLIKNRITFGRSPQKNEAFHGTR